MSVPDGIVRSTVGWLLNCDHPIDRWRPCWFLNTDGYVPPSAVVEHPDGTYWLHTQEFTENGDSYAYAGPYSNLTTALVILRLERASGDTPKRIHDAQPYMWNTRKP